MLPAHEELGGELANGQQPRCSPLQNQAGQEGMWPLSDPGPAVSQQSPARPFPCPLRRCQALSRAAAKSKPINARSAAGCPRTHRLNSSNSK